MKTSRPLILESYRLFHLTPSVVAAATYRPPVSRFATDVQVGSSSVCPTDLTLSCAAGPACRSRSGAAVAAHDVRRTESRTATAVTPWRSRRRRQLGCRAEAGPHQLQREVSRRIPHQWCREHYLSHARRSQRGAPSRVGTYSKHALAVRRKIRMYEYLTSILVDPRTSDFGVLGCGAKQRNVCSSAGAITGARSSEQPSVFVTKSRKKSAPGAGSISACVLI